MTNHQTDEQQQQKELQKQKDIRDTNLPNQGVGFLYSGTTDELEKARAEYAKEKEAFASNTKPKSKNNWVGPQPQQRGIGSGQQQNPMHKGQTADVEIRESDVTTNQAPPRKTESKEFNKSKKKD